jgi:tripartite-type tricarboxylate transporter receptor subunit TctC
MADVPTLKEQGHDVELAQVIGFMAPANTSKAIVDLLHAKINEILAQPDVQSALKARNAEVMLLSREEHASFLRAELARWGEVIRRADIKIDK